MAPKIDLSDLLFIWELDNIFGATLIPVKLVGSENYRAYSRSMRIALLWKKKLNLWLMCVAEKFTETMGDL